MNEKIKSLLSFLFRIGLSIVLLSYLFTKINVEQTLSVVKSARLIYFLYAFITFGIIHYFILVRWVIFIKALELDISLLSTVRFFFIGLFGNLFLPSAIGGDVVKTIGLCTNSSQKPKVVASVLLDRLSGFAGMVVIATFSFIGGYRLINDRTLSVSIIMMAVVSSFLAILLFNEKWYSFACRVFSPFPKVKQGLMNVHYDIVLLKNKKRTILKAVGISALSQAFLAVTFYLISKALHQEVAYIYFLIFVPLICVASCFPSIGGLGVREAGAAFLLAKVGVAYGVAVSISLINFVFMVIVGVGGWIFFLLTKSPESSRQQ